MKEISLSYTHFFFFWCGGEVGSRLFFLADIMLCRWRKTTNLYNKYLLYFHIGKNYMPEKVKYFHGLF